MAADVCGATFKYIGYFRRVQETTCTREPGHEGPHDAEVWITVVCSICHRPNVTLDHKHAEAEHTGCQGYPYCPCKTPHEGNCTPDTARADRAGG